MSKPREALECALVELRGQQQVLGRYSPQTQIAINKVNAALAELEQEPAFLVRIARITEKPTGVFLPTDSPELRSEYLVPVYTSPQPREWQELSEDEKKKMFIQLAEHDSYEEDYQAISAALRAKNEVKL